MLYTSLEFSELFFLPLTVDLSDNLINEVGLDTLKVDYSADELLGILLVILVSKAGFDKDTQAVRDLISSEVLAQLEVSLTLEEQLDSYRYLSIARLTMLVDRMCREILLIGLPRQYLIRVVGLRS